MKKYVLAFLLTFYPLHSFAVCDSLHTGAFPIKVAELTEMDIEYNRIVDQYKKQHFENYRPESFFTRQHQRIKRLQNHHISPDNVELKNKITKQLIDFNKQLSRYKHFDNTIIDKLTRLAELKYTRSFYCLGFVYELGIGHPVDYAQSWAWFYTAVSVDGVLAMSNLDRLSKHLSGNNEVKAKGTADKYIRLYTNFNKTPSVTIIR